MNIISKWGSVLGMKKMICLLISIIFLLCTMSTLSFATQEELVNIAPNGLAYASSEKNTRWTPVIALNDGAYSSDTWQGWECAYPTVQKGQDTSKGFDGEYCGIRFDNGKYYEIHQIKLNLGLHPSLGGQNMKYTIECLVDGQWVTVLEFKDESISGYNSIMASNNNGHVASNWQGTLSEPVTTNNVRIQISEFGKNYQGGDIMVFPYIYELELIGKEGVAPEVIVPEGGHISTNIAYQSYVEASSSNKGAYPFLAIDSDERTAWSPSSSEANEWLVIKYPSPKNINKIVVDFGEGDSKKFKPTFYYMSQDGWKRLEISSASENEYLFDALTTSSVKLVFEEKSSEVPTVYELETHLADAKTYYFERFTSKQINSVAKGNIAVIGTPYASDSLEPYSSLSYIIDGHYLDKDNAWFTGKIDMPAYAGITFDEKQSINKVVLYVTTPDKIGDDVMGIEIQALIDGEYKTVADGKSYNEQKGYASEYTFDSVETTDIRVNFTSGNGTFANIVELELYSPNGVIKMFDGVEYVAETEREFKIPTEEKLPQIEEAEKEEPSTLEIVLDLVFSACALVLLAIIVWKYKNKKENEL